VAEPPLNILDRLKDPKFGDLTESTIHFESTEEATARRHEASEQAKHKRKERLIILWFALAMVFGFSVWCIYVYVTGSADDKKWAQTIVASICTGLLTYAVGHRND
jgi:cation transport ATPase